MYVSFLFEIVFYVTIPLTMCSDVKDTLSSHRPNFV